MVFAKKVKAIRTDDQRARGVIGQICSEPAPRRSASWVTKRLANVGDAFVKAAVSARGYRNLAASDREAGTPVGACVDSSQVRQGGTRRGEVCAHFL